MSALPEIYADFQNADVEGRVRLNCVGTINDLSRRQVQLREGLGVLLYSDDPDENGEARLLVEGTVQYSQDEQCWVAVIDWQAIRRELTASESRTDAGSAVIFGSNAPTSPPPRPAGR